MKSKFSALLALAFMTTAASPQDGRPPALSFGGDQFTGGQNVTVADPVDRDAFMAGNNVTLTGPVGGDAHLAGFDVNASAPVTGNVYAIGYSVEVTAGVGGDLTAAANNVSVRADAAISGNTRIAAQSVSIAAPVSGAALITAQTLNLDAPVAGDFRFYGERIEFGPAAQVAGKVEIFAPAAIEVPASVASADRVTFTQFTSPDYVQEAGKTAAETVVRRFWPAFWAAALGWLVLFVIGIALIAFTPRWLERLRVVSERRPFRNFGMGVLVLAALLGLVPLVAITIVGLLVVPILLGLVGIVCLLGYLLGTYFVGVRIASAFTQVTTNVARAVVLAVSLVIAGLLAMVPVIGWLLSLVLVIFGLGVMGVVLMVRWSARDAERLQETGRPPPAPAQ